MLNVVENPKPASASKPQSKELSAAVERERMVAWLAERIRKCQREAVTEVVTLTPVLAELLLESNEANRPISRAGLDRLVRDIRGGRWEFNGESVIVSKDGKLNDGQHRCRAVIEAGRSVPVVIVFGPQRQSRMTLDVGATRTVGNFLGMHGYTDTNHIAAVAGHIHAWKASGEKRVNSRKDSTPGARPTKTEVLAVAQKYHASIAHSLQIASRKGATSVANKSILAFAHWAIADRVGEHGVHQADAFINKLIDGDALEKNDPILICRNKLIEMRQQTGTWVKPIARAAMIFKAWNAFRTGEAPTRIWASDKLPELVG